MLITKNNRKQFDQLLNEISQSDMMVVDTETNGLDLWGDDIVVGIAIYLPKFDTSYYVSVAHGIGTLTSLTDEDVDSLKWSNRNKKLVLTQSIYDEFYRTKAQADNIPASWLDELRKVWSIPKTMLTHNAQFDLTALHLLNFPSPKTCLDTMLAAHVLYSDWNAARFIMPDTKQTEQGNRQLKWLARLTGLESAKEGKDDLTTNIANLSNNLRLHDRHTIALDVMSSLWMLPASEVAIYAESDVRLTYGLLEVFTPRMEELGVLSAFYRLCDIQYLAAWRMALTGFRIDMDTAISMIIQGDDIAGDLVKEFEDKTNGASITSPIQIRRYLNSIGIDVLKADKEIIETHKDSVPILQIVAEHRDATRMVTNYIRKWVDNVQVTKDGRIHPNFNVTGAKTYRWSSSDKAVGNLQNIPRDVNKELSPKMVLLPISDNHHLVEIDYSTLEMRLAAWVAESIVLKGSNMQVTEMLLSGADLHMYTCNMTGIHEILLGNKPVTADNVYEYLSTRRYNMDRFTDDKSLIAFYMKNIARHHAKTFNFSVLYGGGARATMKQMSIPYNDATTIIQGWKKAYPTLNKALDVFEALALKDRPMRNNKNKSAMYIEYPLFDLIRRYEYYDVRVPTSNGGYRNPRKEAARGAFNSIVQGTSGVICTNSAMTIAKKYPDDDLLALQASVHDSIILSIKPENMYILHDVAAIMCNYPVYPALAVDIEIAPIGRAWGYKTHVDLSAIPTEKDEPYELPTT